MYIIGKVIKPHGIHGELKVNIITSYPEHFQELEQVFVKEESKWQAYSIDEVKRSDRFVLLKLDDIDSLEEAENFRNHFIYIPENELKTPEKDEYFIHDLIDMDVYDENSGYIGKIKEVMQYTSNDVYVIKTPDEVDKLVPAVKDIVRRIDIKQKRMTIRVIEGLLD
ncbi:MAG: 16S rRNA processing protein RimM [Caldithrix sp.]|nr:16S rRNA processing protein RimM [Caldithrix sp.]